MERPPPLLLSLTASLLLALLILLHTSIAIGTDSSSSTIEITSSGETLTSTYNVAYSKNNSTTCEPTPLLQNKLSTCKTYQIATLNSSPRRCLHIEFSQSSSNKDENTGKEDDNDDKSSPTFCQNFPNWFDGTNGCSAYEHPSHRDWCQKYGDFDFSHHTPYKAKEACCICGGGTTVKARLNVGDIVKIKSRQDIGASTNDRNERNNNVLYRNMENCKSLQINEIQTKPSFAYKVQVLKACGRNVVQKMGDGRIHYAPQYQPGMIFTIDTDNPDVIDRHDRVELRKCREGKPQQEFVLEAVPVGKYEQMGEKQFWIRHLPTDKNLADVMGLPFSELELRQVFEEGSFDGSGDFVFIESREGTESNIKNGMPKSGDVDDSALLISGSFGEMEYSEAEWKSRKNRRDLDESPFSMWTFLPVESWNDNDDIIAPENTAPEGTKESHDNIKQHRDEHAQWLERMTHLIGIDYLQEMAPWHLLDVERESSKSEVKSRFRDLSRSFHPDKVRPEKRDLFEKIFVLLQDAYGGLKSANEADKEMFRSKADYDSQLFTHSKYVVELLPFHWTNATEMIGEEMKSSWEVDRFVLNAASHLNMTLFDNAHSDEEDVEPSFQLWVVFLYSSRCSMSRTVEGFVDIAARNLEERENIKVGAYGCGLYKEFKATDKDVLGISTDPICKQFRRQETPNVHVIVETIPGRKRNEYGEFVEVPPDPQLMMEAAKYNYFYSAVPDGNTTEFYPHRFIRFAKTGKRIWNDLHLVKKMTTDDFRNSSFASTSNATIVAFLDGTGVGDTNQEVADAISATLPGVARRFAQDGVQVGIANCGYGDEYEEEDGGNAYNVDCSKLDVSWLPDIKIYGKDDKRGTSLLRGQFGDRRDVQIALEGMGNVLRMMLGGQDGNEDDDIDEIKKDNDDVGGDCSQNDRQQPPPPQYDYNMEDLEQIDGRMEETPLLAETEKQPEQESHEKEKLIPNLEDKKEKPKKPKLSSGEGKPQLDGARETLSKDRISGFSQRSQKRRGGGKVLGGTGGGSAGAIGS